MSKVTSGPVYIKLLTDVRSCLSWEPHPFNLAPPHLNILHMLSPPWSNPEFTKVQWFYLFLFVGVRFYSRPQPKG